MRLSVEDFFVARVPRLSLKRLRDLPIDTEALHRCLAEWITDPIVHEAVYLASPSLLERLPGWRENPSTKEGRKVTQALLKYFVRMSSRATPFGLFSGIALGSVGEDCALLCRAPTLDQRKTRLDLGYLDAIRDELAASGEIALRYRSNPTLRRVHHALHYIEPYKSGDLRHYRLSAVAADDAVSLLLELAREGASKAELVAEFHARHPDVSTNDIADFLDALVKEALLVPILPIPLTDSAPDRAFAQALQHSGPADTAGVLGAALQALDAIDDANEANVADYKGIKTSLETLPYPLKEGRLFQVDLRRGFSRCELPRSTLQAMAEQLTLLTRLNTTQSVQKDGGLRDFIGRFQQRYEGQLVPLLQALDEETGISMSLDSGYRSELLAGLQLQEPSHAAGAAGQSPSLLERLVLEALTAPENASCEVLRLCAKDLKAKLPKSGTADAPRLPRSLAAMFAVYSDEQQQTLLHFKGCYGPSAAKLLGRFCHLDDTLYTKLRAHLQAEEAHSPQAVFAEVVHLPDGRPGNVIARPPLREHDIVFLGDSGSAEERQIPVSDLHVFVEGGQVKLWSQRLQQQVVPRLSSAHNYSSRSLGIYRFMCMLQQQGVCTPRFSLPGAFSQAFFVPRIQLDNLILQEKRWRLPRENVEALVKDGKWQARAWQELQERFRLDRWVTYAVSDNVLTLDLHNPALVEILLAETSGLTQLTLSEALHMTLTPAVQAEHEPTEGFAHEFVVPLICEDAPVEQARIEQVQRSPGLLRNSQFSPGSSWMSLKIYGAPSSVENVLATELPQVLREQVGNFEQWFFIRYGDPDWHLRLRFRGVPERLYGRLLPALHQSLEPLLQAGVLHRLELFTYARETQRYGGDHGIELAEALFMHESQMLVRGMSLLRDFGESCRWRMALMASDALLEAFGYDTNAKFVLIDRQRQAFGREFSEGKTLRQQLGDKYRRNSAHIAADLAPVVGQAQAASMGTEDQGLHGLRACVEDYRHAVRPLADAYRQHAKAGQLSCSLDSLLSSLLHMLNNRVFKTQGRAQELVVYDLLRRHYLRLRSEGGARSCRLGRERNPCRVNEPRAAHG